MEERVIHTVRRTQPAGERSRMTGLLLSGQVFLQTEDHKKTLLEMKSGRYCSDSMPERGAVEAQALLKTIAEGGQVFVALAPLSACLRGRGSSSEIQRKRMGREATV